VRCTPPVFCCSVAKLYLTLCDPMDSMPDFPVLHYQPPDQETKPDQHPRTPTCSSQCRISHLHTTIQTSKRTAQFCWPFFFFFFFQFCLTHTSYFSCSRPPSPPPALWLELLSSGYKANWPRAQGLGQQHAQRTETFPRAHFLRRSVVGEEEFSFREQSTCSFTSALPLS